MHYLTKHLHDVDETYGEHFQNAGYYGWRMVTCGAACLLHAVFPFAFEKTASQCIQDLYMHMTRHGRTQITNDENIWMEFNI